MVFLGDKRLALQLDFPGKQQLKMPVFPSPTKVASAESRQMPTGKKRGMFFGISYFASGGKQYFVNDKGVVVNAVGTCHRAGNPRPA